MDDTSQLYGKIIKNKSSIGYLKELLKRRGLLEKSKHPADDN